MRTTSREGFEPPFCRLDSQDGSHNVQVRNKDSGQRADHVESRKHEDQHLFEAGIGAGEGHQRDIITPKMIDDIGATVDQSESNNCGE